VLILHYLFTLIELIAFTQCTEFIGLHSFFNNNSLSDYHFRLIPLIGFHRCL